MSPSCQAIIWNQCWLIVNSVKFQTQHRNLHTTEIVISECPLQNGGNFVSVSMCYVHNHLNNYRWPLLIDLHTHPVGKLPSSLWYKTHLSWQLNCRSLRCSWSIACRRCSNNILILDLIHGFNRLCEDNCKVGRESLKFWNFVRLILETLR